MTSIKHYFFCGIGGSGMLPLAVSLKASGHMVDGSDRSLDQGRTPEKFDYLRGLGIGLYAQDGSGLTSSDQILVVSGAVEATVPDVQAAERVGAKRITRAELLSVLFNGAKQSVGVAGTSGKSTTTGMVGWVLHRAGQQPTILNGASMKNFMSSDQPFASSVTGRSDALIVAEVDESDGSIARYDPTIAVLNNIAFDHKTMDELRQLFGDFIGKAKTAIVNLDNAETAELAKRLQCGTCMTYSLQDDTADLFGENLQPAPDGIAFNVVHRATSESHWAKIQMPGAHNVSNAMAAMAAAQACGVSLADSVSALASFEGIKRRLEYVGRAADVTVLDDFAHNPDKITASLSTLHAFPGRLLVMFQPHGFGPLRLMKQEFIECFGQNMHEDDVLVMPEPVYYGGTVERTVTSGDIAEGVEAMGRQAYALEDRDACGRKLVEMAKSGDRIVIMGARDDSLSTFAEDLLSQLRG